MIPDISADYTAVIDDLMESELTSEQCKVYYPAKKVECSNCVPGPFGGSNIYKNGGPAPFDFGICPLCQGKGFKEEETFDTIRLRVHFFKETGEGAKKFEKTIVNNPDFKAQIYGYLTDVPKVNKADYLVLCSAHTNYIAVKCRLQTAPTNWGFGKDRYFTCNLSRYE